ncbi:MAG: ribonuclease HI family protein [Candidatus Rokubacteria bacterium]|nr:ribonuclease HI family protein [Candidatus Rokubacteria bacterium]
MTRFSTLVCYVDGSVEGNPGPGAIGVVIEDGRGTPVEAWGEAIGHCTNNQAEYQALLAALRKARRLGAKTVTVRSDSQLLVRQFLGEYKVRDAKLKPLHEEARRLARAFPSFEIVHIPREQNRAADRLANRARLAQ